MRRKPDNLQNLLDKVAEFINEEETLKAMRSAQKLPKKLKDKKRKESRKMDKPKPFKKKFNNYDFAPFNANISEVLMEEKKTRNIRSPQE